MYDTATKSVEIDWYRTAAPVFARYAELAEDLKQAASRITPRLTMAQSYMLLAMQEERLTVSDLEHTKAYLGCNVSYNVKKLTELGCISYSVSQQDARVRYVSLTEKGTMLRDKLIQYLQYINKGNGI
jgi:DNA-binding MarR family transcriptional regulator